ncbi:CD276 antigen [Siphateles boraxobius]|uniref:CD276 antigen n=1 Tax=Siphateles boraxobius TaxID=180520 RepID=UPI004064806D
MAPTGKPASEFEIIVPRGPVTGFYGEAVILPCTFPVDSWDLSSTIITWQLELDVVHSFYYSRDQLDRQNPHYVKRTSLFIQEMATGNASLKLDRVTLQDAGVYTCSISTNTGSQKKSFKVKIAAFYSEPRLQFSMLTYGLNLLVTSDGGYPSPKLQWLMENSDITNQTQTHLMEDTQTGLYIVSSWINLTEVTNSSLTFRLHNKPLGQDIRREILLYSDKKRREGQSAYRWHGYFTLIPVMLLLIVMGLLILFNTRRTEQTKQNGLFNGLKSQISACPLESMHHDVVQTTEDSRSSSGVIQRIYLLPMVVDRDMNLKVVCLSFLLFEASCFTEFEITVPRGPVTGFYGEALILPCTFPVDSWDLSSTVITWQRELDVVHSFYYSRDQLDRQNPHYVKRTSLFIQEMATGNASLKLDRVTLQDAGVYTCSISTNTGSQKKSFKVKIAAFYSEPRLQFSMLTDGLNLLVTSDGGYPSPKLQWLMENSDITNQTQTHLMEDTQTGLYIVSSWINLTEVTNSSLTFRLHNKPLGQDIRREILLYSDKKRREGHSAYRWHGYFTLIPVLLLLIVMGLLILFNTRRRTEQTKQNGLFNGLKSQISACPLESMHHDVV